MNTDDQVEAVARQQTGLLSKVEVGQERRETRQITESKVKGEKGDQESSFFKNLTRTVRS